MQENSSNLAFEASCKGSGMQRAVEKITSQHNRNYWQEQQKQKKENKVLQSWLTGEVPVDWRLANVTPIYKRAGRRNQGTIGLSA
ncbi:hypothetical protein QYF61_027386 [Mycteria americana]|uniref:Uncharacterized protein n=1 Tax=Mycteria americana TaxID=33587 RepID=A0AAN7N843_MYCAM|nr:hypothetical protein QYF61_027386 [Mycteria americana]